MTDELAQGGKWRVTGSRYVHKDRWIAVRADDCVTEDGVVARCAGIDTKEAADALRGLRLHVPRSALPEPEEDEFYLADLIGLTVRHAVTDDLIGRIKSVQNFGADDLLEITPALGGQTWYLPFTRAAVPEVKIAEGLVLADPPAMVGEPEGPLEGGDEV